MSEAAYVVRSILVWSLYAVDRNVEHTPAIAVDGFL